MSLENPTLVPPAENDAEKKPSPEAVEPQDRIIKSTGRSWEEKPLETSMAAIMRDAQQERALKELFSDNPTPKSPAEILKTTLKPVPAPEKKAVQKISQKTKAIPVSSPVKPVATPISNGKSEKPKEKIDTERFGIFTKGTRVKWIKDGVEQIKPISMLALNKEGEKVAIFDNGEIVKIADVVTAGKEIPKAAALEPVKAEVAPEKIPQLVASMEKKKENVNIGTERTSRKEREDTQYGKYKKGIEVSLQKDGVEQKKTIQLLAVNKAGEKVAIFDNGEMVKLTDVKIIPKIERKKQEAAPKKSEVFGGIKDVEKEASKRIGTGVTVQWIVNGSEQFPMGGKEIKKMVSDPKVSKERYAFFEGSEAGVPESQLVWIKAANIPKNNKSAPKESGKAAEVPAAETPIVKNETPAEAIAPAAASVAEKGAFKPGAKFIDYLDAKKSEITATGAEEIALLTETKIEAAGEKREAIKKEPLTKEQREQKFFKHQADRYGFKDMGVPKVLGRGVRDTIATIFAARSPFEIAKLISGIGKNKEGKRATYDLVKEIQKQMPTRGEKALNREDAPTAIREKMAKLNGKLMHIDLPPQEKRELRAAMAKILVEYRHQKEDLTKHESERVGKVFDIYANNSAQMVTAAKEAANTALVFASAATTPLTFGLGLAVHAPLRTLSYMGFGAIGSVAKASNEYNKKQFERELNELNKARKSGNEIIPEAVAKIAEAEKAENRLSYIAKAMTIGSAKQMYNGVVNPWQEQVVEKPKEEVKGFWNKTKSLGSKFFGSRIVRSGLAATPALFSLMRLGGMAEFDHAIATGAILPEAGNKFFDALKTGDFTAALKQGGENWVNNAERILHIGLPTPDGASHIMHGKEAMQPDTAAVTTGQAALHPNAAEGIAAQNPAENHNFVAGQVNGENISAGTKIETTEVIQKLATIGKTEGIEHAFIRQIEQNPQAFGFHGDIANHADIHRFAGNMAHQIAIENHYVDVDKGTEIRIKFDEKNPSAFIIKPDHTVTEINTNESKYVQNVRDLVKQTVEKHDALGHTINESLGIEHENAYVMENGQRIELHKEDHNWYMENGEKYRGTQIPNFEDNGDVPPPPPIPEENQGMSQLEMHNGKGLEYRYPSGVSNSGSEMPPPPDMTSEEIAAVSAQEAKSSALEEQRRAFESVGLHAETVSNASEHIAKISDHLDFGKTHATFLFDKNNHVIDLNFRDMQGPADYAEKFSYLKADWRGELIDKGIFNPLVQDKISNHLTKIQALHKILRKLEGLGDSNGERSQAVLKNLSKEFDALKKFGNILNTDIKAGIKTK